MDTHARLGQPLQGADTNATIFLERPPLDLPLDLSAWVAPETIARWIREALENLDLPTAGVSDFSQLSTEQRPQILLSVLLFAYATERFISSEIFAACHTHPVLKAFCEGKAPFPDELEHFRRKNRLLLETLLGDIIKRAVREKFLPTDQLPPGLQNSLQKRAVDQIDTARHLSTLEGSGS